MAFCGFSTEILTSTSTAVDNEFIVDFMIDANEIAVKVYLYGLYLSGAGDTVGNNINKFANVLGVSVEDIVSCFFYWESMGLVAIIKGEPIEVRYLPTKYGSRQLKKYNTDKYKNFNFTAQEILSGRMITPSEFQAYYDLIESRHIDDDALLMIMKYCTKLKDNNVGYKYITTVASNWAYEGIHTCDDVEDKLKEMELKSGDIASVLKALNIKRSATIDEYDSFNRWLNLGFDLSIIMFLCKKAKNLKGGFNKLDNLINKCYSAKVYSVKEINDFFNSQDELYLTAKVVAKNLGVRYENLEMVVDTYLSNWIILGYQPDSIVKISELCFLSGIRNFSGMNQKMVQLSKMGLITIESLDNYISQETAVDSDILKVLQGLGIERNINSHDRTLYKLWTVDWQLNDEIINYGIKLSIDKYMPIQYLSKILSIYHEKGITKVEEAKALNIDFGKIKQTVPQNQRVYSKEELACLFTPISEIEL